MAVTPQAHTKEGNDSRPCVSSTKNVAVWHVAFVVTVLVCLILPFVFMPLASDDVTSEKRELASKPELTNVDGRPNLNFLSDAGSYFEDHFAFRNLLVDADTSLKQHLFMTSATENVIVGSDGWLFYAGTLNDYQRKNPMSYGALCNAVHNLELIQEYFGSQGKRFMLAIAPNKNELYNQGMPYYDLAGEGASNFERLTELLDQHDINYVNLHNAFAAEKDVLYFKRDSHWNDQGALLAYDQIMRAFQKTPVPFADGATSMDAHKGDVDAMLHPLYAEAESQVHYDDTDAFAITNDATSVEDNYIVTTANAATTQDRLLMYRDSFGNNLLPALASTYRQVVFTKLVPYDMGHDMTAFANDVVVERTERHLSFFATTVPYMPAPGREVNIVEDGSRDGATIYIAQNGAYLEVAGSLNGENDVANGNVYVEVSTKQGETHCYEAFRVSAESESNVEYEGSSSNEESYIEGDRGYRAYISNDMFSVDNIAQLRVAYGSEQSASVVAVY